MDENQLQALAAFLGVEATPEAILPALQQLISTLSTEGQTQYPDEAMAAMRSALKAEDNAAMIASFQSFADALKGAGDEGDGAGSDEASARLTALSTFNAGFQATKSAPKPSNLPYLTGEDDKSAPGKKSPKHGKTFSIGGRAEKPSLVGMLRDLRSLKAQSYEIGPTGGYLMRHEVVDTFLPALRAKLPLMDMGVDDYPMDGIESLTIPKDKTELTAYWVGEDKETTESPEETTGTITLYPRPIACRVIVPNKFLQNSIVDYEARVRDKATYAINRGIMDAVLFGTGAVSGSGNTGAQPLGLFNRTGVTQTACGLPGSNGGVPTITEVAAAIGRLEDADVDESETWAWLFSPRSKRVFINMSDEEGRPLWRDYWAGKERPDLLGYKWYTTTLIPDNQAVGSSTDCSSIFLGDWYMLALGLSNQFEVMVNPYRLAHKLQTEIIIHTYADAEVKYDEAFEILTGVRSGGV